MCSISEAIDSYCGQQGGEGSRTGEPGRRECR
jgi:hypothetical protein